MWKNGKIRIFFTVALVLLLSACSDFQKVQKSDDIDKKYESAVKYYESGDYYRAGLLFEEIIPLLAGSKQAELSKFYYAYCHYHQDQLYMANYYFGNFIQTFPRSDKAEEAWFMKCKSLYQQTPASNLEQSATMEALNAIQMFANRFPNSTYLPEVNKMVDKLNAKLEKKEYDNAKLYHQLRYYKAAVIAFDNFIREYPGSDKLEEMYFLKIESQFNLAEVSVYNKQLERYNDAIKFYQNYIDKFPSGKKLNQAEQIYDQILNRVDKVKEREEAIKYELAKDQLNKRKYNQAFNTSSDFLVDYPASKYLEEVTVFRLDAQYHLAINEPEASVKKESLQKTKEYYEAYKAKFPSSKTTKKADYIHSKTTEELNKLNDQGM